MSDVVKRRERSYDEETIERGLITLAACAGNDRLASRRLAEDGITIPNSTLRDWSKKQHPERYARIRAQFLPRIKEEAADRHRAQEELDLLLSQRATERILAELPQMEHKDLIQAKNKADIGSGIHAEKALVYDEEPTFIPPDAGAVLRKLKARGLVVDAEVVSEEDATPDIQAPSTEP